MKTKSKAPDKMTEQGFIAKFKKAGFDLYKTKDLRPKLKWYYANHPDEKKKK